MEYVNGGIIGATTKKALREAVKADPTSVRFYGTSPLGAQFSGPVSGMPDGVTLSVCGPDPYNARNWWASITRNPSGGFKVS